MHCIKGIHKNVRTFKTKSRCVHTAINHQTCYLIRYSRLKSHDIGNYAARILSGLSAAAAGHSLPPEFGAQILHCGRPAAQSAPQPRIQGWGGDTWQRCPAHAPSPPPCPIPAPWAPVSRITPWKSGNDTSAEIERFFFFWFLPLTKQNSYPKQSNSNGYEETREPAREVA